MLKEIQEFEQKFEEMKIASSNLDRVVEKAMKDASTDELYELTDLLPKQYRGLRRIYQSIIEKEDKKV
jgi:hypothetical protein